MMKHRGLVILLLLNASILHAANTVTGVVYLDANGNLKRDADERGIPAVRVSNGHEVVTTGRTGAYSLPAYDDMVVFVVKPTGYGVPVDANNMPQFYYTHKPAGSPNELKTYRGLAPTGDLPESVDFALTDINEPTAFKAIITGDTQPYTDEQIDFLRDSLVTDVRNHHRQALFCLSMGDNVGDVLSLYPRYFATMGQLGMPVYYVPGNHDLDYDVSNSEDSFDTFKSYAGPTYYSFNVGQVHFVVLCDVDYPSPRFSSGSSKAYNGLISDLQMEWLANDLDMTPDDYLIVLNMHIPVASNTGAASVRHQVDNRENLYELLADRNAMILTGHTHTMSYFLPGDELDGWGQPTPITQIIVGAACGSGWNGPLDAAGVPMSYMRCGAPRNYLVLNFDGNDYQVDFQPTLQAADKQMHLSFQNENFEQWYQNNATENPRQEQGREALTDRNVLNISDLRDSNTALVINVYAGTNDSEVWCQWDDQDPIKATKTTDFKDPYALLNEMLYTTRWSIEGLSTHLWTCGIPAALGLGQHAVTVTTTDLHGRTYTENLVFEVTSN